MRPYAALLIAWSLAGPGPSLPASANVTVALGTDRTKQVIRGTVVTPDTVFVGEVVIEADTIACVAPDCTDPPGASVFTVTDGYIYPGFIDAHNHVAYNVLPKWTPPKLYINRGQWQRAKSYQEFKAPYNVLKDTDHLFCEMVKWGEIKAMISGITAVEGTSPGSVCVRTLIRNVENQNELGTSASHIRTYILDISSFKGTVDWNVTKAFVVHIAEGLPSDERSRHEFEVLKQKGLLRAETAIIHGTAFGDSEFTQMGAVGAKLIWSPQSNRVLYGQTTNIPLALQHGVSVSLGVDWNPSGSDDLFGELRVAAEFNQDQFGGVIKGPDWIRMITVNPAKALALDTQIGRLAPGFKADITVLRSQNSDPHLSLLANHPQDVEMVWIGGELLYGRESVLQKFRPGCEALEVNGSKKRVCVVDTTNPVDKSGETLAQIRTILLSKYAQLSPLVR
ncbi:MAG TPA: amidohydrolase family protein [Gemmatimonadales bacterium]|jgi:cytosine/adenosine deaminase-related metal-dependent hydrolase|nr:amidohydrolase family protein [Gemmatimonadales bacterium]